MNTNKIYPGMLCAGIEFFVHDDEEKVIQGGVVKDLAQAPYSVFDILEEAIDADESVKAALLKMHPLSKHQRLRQFVRCRFGGLDMQPDIKAGVLQEAEYWPCPLRGSCPAEGVLCKMPRHNGNELSKDDISLMKLIATDRTNKSIADVLNVPLGTFHRNKTALYNKLGIITKQEVALIAVALNLI